MMRSVLLAALLVPVLSGQGTTPKPKAAEYPTQGKAGELEIGAEYMVRTIFLEKTSITTDEYLVVEVALYPPRGAEIAVNAQHFNLRLNGKKDALFPQAPSFVAASIKYPDWSTRPQIAVGAGPVIIGRRSPVERFPGDNRDPSTRMPSPVPPVATGGEGGRGTRDIDPAEELQRIALPEGTARGPVSGFLFFAYGGKLKSIKQVELLYRPGSGDAAVLRLR
jgi:hypothetical protein